MQSETDQFIASLHNAKTVSVTVAEQVSPHSRLLMDLESTLDNEETLDRFELLHSKIRSLHKELESATALLKNTAPFLQSHAEAQELREAVSNFLCDNSRTGSPRSSLRALWSNVLGFIPAELQNSSDQSTMMVRRLSSASSSITTEENEIVSLKLKFATTAIERDDLHGKLVEMQDELKKVHLRLEQSQQNEYVDCVT